MYPGLFLLCVCVPQGQRWFWRSSRSKAQGQGCHDVEEGLPLTRETGAKWAGPVGMRSLASKVEGISCRPICLKMEYSALVLEFSVLGGVCTWPGHLLRRVRGAGLALEGVVWPWGTMPSVRAAPPRPRAAPSADAHGSEGINLRPGGPCMSPHPLCVVFHFPNTES